MKYFKKIIDDTVQKAVAAYHSKNTSKGSTGKEVDLDEIFRDFASQLETAIGQLDPATFVEEEQVQWGAYLARIHELIDNNFLQLSIRLRGFNEENKTKFLITEYEKFTQHTHQMVKIVEYWMRDKPVIQLEDNQVVGKEATWPNRFYATAVDYIIGREIDFRYTAPFDTDVFAQKKAMLETYINHMNKIFTLFEGNEKEPTYRFTISSLINSAIRDEKKLQTREAAPSSYGVTVMFSKMKQMVGYGGNLGNDLKELQKQFSLWNQTLESYIQVSVDYHF